MSALADGDLVRLAQRRDKGAFGELFTRYEGRIFGYLYRMVGDRAWAEDLTQDTFIRAPIPEPPGPTLQLQILDLPHCREPGPGRPASIPSGSSAS